MIAYDKIILEFHLQILMDLPLPLRGFRSPSGVVSKPISGHSFEFFQNFFPGIDRPEHSAQKSVSVALAR